MKSWGRRPPLLSKKDLMALMYSFGCHSSKNIKVCYESFDSYLSNVTDSYVGLLRNRDLNCDCNSLLFSPVSENIVLGSTISIPLSFLSSGRGMKKESL